MTDTQPQRPALLSDAEIEDAIDRANLKFNNYRSSGPRGQQLSTRDDWKHWLSREIEAAALAKLGEPVAAVASERADIPSGWTWESAATPAVEVTDAQIDAIDLRTINAESGEAWIRAMARAVLALTRPGSKA